MVDRGETFKNIDLDELFFYFEKRNRKRFEKAFTDIKFDQILLTINDRAIKEEMDYPFECTKRELKMQ